MKKKANKKTSSVKKKDEDTMGGFGYVLGFIGASVYYVVSATSFWGGVLGILKALVWPAFLVFGLFKLAGM